MQKKRKDQETVENRSQKRISYIREIKIGSGIRRSTDLSIDGMYLEASAKFPVGAFVELQFKLQESDKIPLQLQAQVIYVHEGTGVGVRFLNLSTQDREKIQKFIDQH